MKNLFKLFLALALLLALCACSAEEVPAPDLGESEESESGSRQEDIPPKSPITVFKGQITNIGKFFEGEYELQTSCWLSENELAVIKNNSGKYRLSVINFGTGAQTLVAANIPEPSGGLTASYDFGDYWRICTSRYEYTVRKGDYYVENIYTEENTDLKQEDPSVNGDKFYREVTEIFLYKAKTGEIESLIDLHECYDANQFYNPWSIDGKHFITVFSHPYADTEPGLYSDICVYNIGDNTHKILHFDYCPVYAIWAPDRENTFYTVYFPDGKTVIERRFTDSEDVETLNFDCEFTFFEVVSGGKIVAKQKTADGLYEIGMINFDTGVYEKLFLSEESPRMEANRENGNLFLSFDEDKYFYELQKPVEPSETPQPEQPETLKKEYPEAIPDTVDEWEYADTVAWTKKSKEDYSQEEIDLYMFTNGSWASLENLFEDEDSQIYFDRKCRIFKYWFSLSDAELKALSESRDLPYYEYPEANTVIYELYDEGAYSSPKYLVWRNLGTEETKLIYSGSYYGGDDLFANGLLIINRRSKVVALDAAAGNETEPPFDFNFNYYSEEEYQYELLGIGYDELAEKYVAVYFNRFWADFDEQRAEIMLAVYGKDGKHIKNIAANTEARYQLGHFYMAPSEISFPVKGKISMQLPLGKRADMPYECDYLAAEEYKLGDFEKLWDELGGCWALGGSEDSSISVSFFMRGGKPHFKIRDSKTDETYVAEAKSYKQISETLWEISLENTERKDTLFVDTGNSGDSKISVYFKDKKPTEYDFVGFVW